MKAKIARKSLIKALMKYHRMSESDAIKLIKRMHRVATGRE